MLKLGFTLPILSKICLHKSTTAKFCPFAETDGDLLKKIREDMFGRPSIVFTWKAVVDETFIRDSTNLFKKLPELMLKELYFFLCVKQCQLVRTRDGTRIPNPAILNRVKTIRGVLKIWSCHTSGESDHSVRLKVSTRWLLRKNLL